MHFWSFWPSHEQTLPSVTTSDRQCNVLQASLPRREVIMQDKRYDRHSPFVCTFHRESGRWQKWPPYSILPSFSFAHPQINHHSSLPEVQPPEELLAAFWRKTHLTHSFTLTRLSLSRLLHYCPRGRPIPQDPELRLLFTQLWCDLPHGRLFDD